MGPYIVMTACHFSLYFIHITSLWYCYSWNLPADGFKENFIITS